MRRSVVLSVMLHGTLLGIGWVACRERAKPAPPTEVHWVDRRQDPPPDAEPPPLPRTTPEPSPLDVVLVEPATVAEPINDAWQQPTGELPRVIPPPREPSRWREAALDRVIREAPTATEAKPPASTKATTWTPQPRAPVYVPPSQLPGQNSPPRYPRAARRRGLEGAVDLKVLVSSDGRVLNVELEKSSRHDVLDREAIRAIRSWTFQPATRDGIAVEAWVPVPIVFRLEAIQR